MFNVRERLFVHYLIMIIKIPFHKTFLYRLLILSALCVPIVIQLWAMFFEVNLWDLKSYIDRCKLYSEGLSPYLSPEALESSGSYPFVYIPLFASLLSKLQMLFGEQTLFFVLLFTIILSALTICYTAFKISESKHLIIFMLLFFSVFGGELFLAFRTGNFSILFYAILGLCLVPKKVPVNFLYAVCAVGTLLKFQYAIFFLIPLLYSRKLIPFFTFIALTIAIFATDYIVHCNYYIDWIQTVKYMEERGDTGFGVLYFINSAIKLIITGVWKIETTVPVELVTYALYFTFFSALFYFTAYHIKRDKVYILLITLLCLVLLPRFKIYDFFLLLPISLFITEEWKDIVNLKLKRMFVTIFYIMPIIFIILNAFNMIEHPVLHDIYRPLMWLGFIICFIYVLLIFRRKQRINYQEA